MRKIILAVLGVAAIVGAIFLGNYLIEINQKPKPKFKKQIKTVFVERVQNKEIPIILSATGNLTAKNKIEIYSEVSGVLQPSKKLFKAGFQYSRGETLLRISSDEFYASLQSPETQPSGVNGAVAPDPRFRDKLARTRLDAVVLELTELKNPRR